MRSLGRLSIASLLLLTVALVAQSAHAGQVRITAGPTQTFSPKIVNVNLGDQVVWVWVGGGNHTVTSGDSSTTQPDGLFGFGIAQNNFRFSWKSSQAGNIGFYCEPHAPTMAGRVVVHAPGPPPVDVADFRITEVQFNVPGGLDLIEIANLGKASGNLGRFRIATSVGTPIELPGPTSTPNDIVVSAGQRVVVHLNAVGVNSNSDIYIPSFSPGTGLPDASGSLALYVPATSTVEDASSANTDLIIDYVAWGAGGQANETTAGLAGLWTAGTSINNVAPGHSIEYCASATLERGVNHWAEISPPNFGTNSDCTTPVLSETWGRVKILYHR